MIQHEPWTSTDLACVEQIQMQFASRAVIRLALALCYCAILAFPASLPLYLKAKSEEEVVKRAQKLGNYQLITSRRVLLVFVSVWEPSVMLLSGGFEISFMGVECRFAVVTQTRLFIRFAALHVNQALWIKS